MKTVLKILTLAATLHIAGCGPREDAARNDILHVMHATWDRPDASLDAGPVAISGDYAVADWTQGNMGGRALLVRSKRIWQVDVCGGDALRKAGALKSMGVPASDADALASGLADLEKTISPERLARLASFNGLIRMKPSEGQAR